MTDIQRVNHFLNENAVKFGVPLPAQANSKSLAS
jgi:hypothetical protein